MFEFADLQKLSRGKSQASLGMYSLKFRHDSLGVMGRDGTKDLKSRSQSGSPSGDGMRPKEGVCVLCHLRG